MKKPTNGFTLLEVLTVISILALLVGTAFIGYVQAINARERIRCLNSLRQWTIALEMYCTDHEGSYPRSGDLFNRTTEVGAFMTNYLQVGDAGSYSSEHLPLAMCKSGVATYQNNTAFVGWSLYAGYSGPSPLQNDYIGVNFASEQSTRESGLAIIACVTASDLGGNNWTGHAVRYDPGSIERPQGQVAAWPDGHARWVRFEDLRIATIKFGAYQYFMPKKEL